MAANQQEEAYINAMLNAGIGRNEIALGLVVSRSSNIAPATFQTRLTTALSDVDLILNPLPKTTVENYTKAQG